MYDSRPILLVEDGQATVRTVRSAFGELGINRDVVHVSGADEALAYLRESASGEPAIIFLDSSRGQTGILDLLRVVKQDARLKSIPVIVLAPSSDAQVINESFELGAAGYVVKSRDRQEFIEAVRAIYQYWTLSQVPADL